jgi:hypothetical protein
LTKPWSFVLHQENRNSTLLKAIGKEFSWQSNEKYLVTLPIDTILSVKRIYIRQGVSSYSSLTFSIIKGSCPNNPKLEKTKFWASLNDVNNIEFDYRKYKIQDLVEIM